jgi:hypothetical protein
LFNQGAGFHHFFQKATLLGSFCNQAVSCAGPGAGEP